MAYNNYGMTFGGSYGMQLPPGYGSLGAWGSSDVPSYDLAPVAAINPLEGMKNVGIPGVTDGLGGGATGSLFDNFAGKDGWGGTAIGGLGALASTFLGMKQYGLAKKTLEENKRQFQLNYDAQKQMTNTRLEDRQRARVASNPGAYQSVGAYMGANGVK